MCSQLLHTGLLFFFFFQAEDGIRDRSVSRGLGDVYKSRTTGVSSLSDTAPADVLSTVVLTERSDDSDVTLRGTT